MCSHSDIKFLSLFILLPTRFASAAQLTTRIFPATVLPVLPVFAVLPGTLVRHIYIVCILFY